MIMSNNEKQIKDLEHKFRIIFGQSLANYFIFLKLFSINNHREQKVFPLIGCDKFKII